jgi:hypothetical protein
VFVALALGGLNLVLTLALTRRLREHAALLSARADRAAHGIIEAGRRPADFTATDIHGRPLHSGVLAGDTLVAFLSTDCSACANALPGFVARAAHVPGGRENVLAVVSGEPADATAMVAALSGIARVVVEEHDGVLATAFAARAYPSWCFLSAAGYVLDSDSGLDSVRIPALA